MSNGFDKTYGVWPVEIPKELTAMLTNDQIEFLKLAKLKGHTVRLCRDDWFDALVEAKRRSAWVFRRTREIWEFKLYENKKTYLNAYSKDFVGVATTAINWLEGTSLEEVDREVTPIILPNMGSGKRVYPNGEP